MAPFASQSYGPEWFWRQFPPINPQEEAESHTIWFNFLKPTLTSARLTVGEKGFFLFAYQPNLVARQFGLSQPLPRSLFLLKETVVTSTAAFSESPFKNKMETYNERRVGLDFFCFEPFFLYNEEFDIWWANHYRSKTVEECTLYQYVHDALQVARNEKERTQGFNLFTTFNISFQFPSSHT